MNRKGDEPTGSDLDLAENVRQQTRWLSRRIWVVNSITALVVGAASFAAGRVG